LASPPAQRRPEAPTTASQANPADGASLSHWIRRRARDCHIYPVFPRILLALPIAPNNNQAHEFVRSGARRPIQVGCEWFGIAKIGFVGSPVK
jgi:hypothetical protein